MAAFNKVFTYTFEVLSALLAPVVLQVLQVFVEFGLNPKQHSMLQTKTDCLELRYEV